MAFKYKKSQGQSMVEYIIVTVTLALALLAAGRGSTDSLDIAVQDKQRGYSYALSLSAIPETDDLSELTAYYDSLGKYPVLSNELKTGSGVMNNFVDSYQKFIGPLKNLNVPSVPDINSINPF